MNSSRTSLKAPSRRSRRSTELARRPDHGARVEVAAVASPEPRERKDPSFATMATTNKCLAESNKS